MMELGEVCRVIVAGSFVSGLHQSDGELITNFEQKIRAALAPIGGFPASYGPRAGFLNCINSAITFVKLNDVNPPQPMFKQNLISMNSNK
jgi:hypothetical protein